MTLGEVRAIWSCALSAHGAQKLEQMICGYLDLLSRDMQIGELPGLVSTEGMAQLAGIMLANIESGERPCACASERPSRSLIEAVRASFLSQKYTAIAPSAVWIDSTKSTAKRRLRNPS